MFILKWWPLRCLSFNATKSESEQSWVSYADARAEQYKKWGSVDVKHIPPGGTKLKQHDGKQLCIHSRYKHPRVYKVILNKTHSLYIANLDHNHQNHHPKCPFHHFLVSYFRDSWSEELCCLISAEVTATFKFFGLF